MRITIGREWLKTLFPEIRDASSQEEVHAHLAAFYKYKDVDPVITREGNEVVVEIMADEISRYQETLDKINRLAGKGDYGRA